MSFDFQGLAMCDHANYDQPFLVLCFPIAKAKPALLHAWIACSVSMLADKSPYWRQKAIIHHKYSLKYLREDIQDVCDGSEEWLKATILMLHLFEAHGPSESRSAFSTLHLNAAHQVFRRTLSMRLPASIHELMLLEAYTLRVATNCLFEPTSDLPLDYVLRLTRAYQSASSAFGLTIAWRTTPWVFPIGFELIDHVYRLSWLARRLPLNKRQILEAFSISRVVASPPTDTWAVSYSDAPWYISVVGNLFKYACSCLVSIILASSNQVAPNVDKSIIEGLAALEKLTEQRGVHPGLPWALAILGCAVSTRTDLNRCRSIGARLHGPAGGEVVARVLVLIDGVYELKSASAGRLSAQDLIHFIDSQTIFI
ncbi:Hypothetical predicted protein [Lecanosticta acicola]|uniref:Uncharacterized protein n=1 Tax=Lecanosticta acicola TaxID=111012 RepID=A0AAI8Z3F9_9PEZI|nr:Hypothetical predicted protein [Lecanosticta acicola]